MFPGYLAPRHLAKPFMEGANTLIAQLKKKSLFVECLSVCMYAYAYIDTCVDGGEELRGWSSQLLSGWFPAGNSGCSIPTGAHIRGCEVYHCHVSNIKRAFYDREHQRKHYS